MGKLATIAKNLRAFQVEERLLAIVRRNQSQLIDLNLLQLDSGLDSQGKLLDPPYQSVNYAEMKLHLNPKGVVDLKLTGAFWQGFFMKADKFPVTFGSDDIKSSELEAKYGRDIFGLDKANLDISKEIILPDLQEQFKKAIRI